MITNEQIKELADDPLLLSKFLQKCALAIICKYEEPRIINLDNDSALPSADLPSESGKLNSHSLTQDDFPDQETFDE